MSVDQHSTPGGHPTPEQRQDRKRRARFVKLSRAALDALADRLDLSLASTRLLERLAQELVEEWRYEPRIVPARSRRQLWERYLGYNARCALPALLDAGLVAEHQGVGFEVLCWAEIVSDSPSDYDDRRQRAVKDLGKADRRSKAIEVLYAASRAYELPCSAAHERRESVHERRGRPAETSPIELLELLEPPLPPLSPEAANPRAEGGGESESGTKNRHQKSQPATIVATVEFEDRRERRDRRLVLAAMASLEAERETLDGTVIRNREPYLRGIEKRLAADSDLAADLDAYRIQYPDDSPEELADRADADRRGAGPLLARSTDYILDPDAREAAAMANPDYAAAVAAVLAR